MVNRILLGKLKSVKNYSKVISQAGGIDKLIDMPVDFWMDINNVGKQNYDGVFVKQAKEDSKRIAENCVKSAISVVCYLDKDFPKLLRDIPSCPKVLYYRGELNSDENMIAVVGSRNSSGYGNRIAKELSSGLVRAGLTVASGGARGIDTFAHTGALSAIGDERGRTVAVIGCGLNVVYPRENKYLFEVIAERGVLISEYEPDASPKAQHFPARNRIISGMSLGTVVVEAGKKSGSLITAGMAAEFGRDVFAVPGDVTRNSSVGANCLIKDGAVPVCGVNDILEVIALSQLRTSIQSEKTFADNYEKEIHTKINNCDTEEEKLIIKALCDGGEMQTDQLANSTGMAVADINSIAVIMELKGVIRKNESGFYALI